MKYILILLIFLLFFLAEFFLFNDNKKNLPLHSCRYILVNIVFYFLIINIYNNSYDFYLIIVLMLKIIVDKLSGDLVYSIDLIEHFQNKDLTNFIKERFTSIKNKKLILPQGVLLVMKDTVS